MATSVSSSMFYPPNSTIISNPSSHSHSTSISFSISNSSSCSIKYRRSRISSAYGTTGMKVNRSLDTFSNLSLYDVLGVEIGADTREVKLAYRRLARVLHPDVRSCESSADEFMKVHSAYVTLTDPLKRAEYDRSLVQRRTGGVCSVRYAGGCRRWETDQCW
ncbi:putative DnaJ domain, Chaperone J-domain superfamily [Helianthus anomalus]